MRSAEGRVTSGALLSRDLEIDRIPVGHRGPLRGIRQVMGYTEAASMPVGPDVPARRWWLAMLDWPHDAPYQQRVTAQISVVARQIAGNQELIGTWGLYALEGGILSPVEVRPLTVGQLNGFGVSDSISRIDIGATAVHILAEFAGNPQAGAGTMDVQIHSTLTSRVVP